MSSNAAAKQSPSASRTSNCPPHAGSALFWGWRRPLDWGQRLVGGLPHRRWRSNHKLLPPEKALAFLHGWLGAARKLTHGYYLRRDPLVPELLGITRVASQSGLPRFFADVRRFDVVVDDAFMVRVLNREANLDENFEPSFRGEIAFIAVVSHSETGSGAADEWHEVAPRPLRLADAESNREQIEFYTPGRRLEVAERLDWSARQMHWAWLRAQHSDGADEQVEAAVIRNFSHGRN